MYTIEHQRQQLAQAQAAFDAEWERFDSDEREDKPYPTRALFDATMRLYCEQKSFIGALEARINDALEIEARDMADTSDVEDMIEAGGWNAAVEAFREKLKGESE